MKPGSAVSGVPPVHGDAARRSASPSARSSHPEAITLGIRPNGALDVVLNAVTDAARAAGAIAPDVADKSWFPHVTLAYSTKVQPTAPIIAALGRELPGCDVTVSTVSLIAQQGAERQRNWHPADEIRLGLQQRLPIPGDESDRPQPDQPAGWSAAGRPSPGPRSRRGPGARDTRDTRDALFSGSSSASR